MAKYLYGASCQGIQSFIFETDKLMEVAGGSELVEQLCTSFFDSILAKHGIADPAGSNKITGAAGNIRYVFGNKADAEKIVREFPLRVAEKAPGITISQAVIKLSGDFNKKVIDELEKKLRVQRNRPQRPFDLGFLATQRCRRTARPAVKFVKEGTLDKALAGKLNASNTRTLLKKLVPNVLESKEDCIPFEMEEMVDRKKSAWLAVIHADGNNLGKIFQLIANSPEIKENSSKSLQDAYRKFSTNLDKATIAAAQSSFGKIILKDDYINDSGKYPIRPIIIAGDDLTVICRADLAIKFTKVFLTEFQRQTKEKLSNLAVNYKLKDLENGLTACAGIAFIKPKYPFHYAADLAEELCGQAKKVSKLEPGNVPSSLAFYKVRSIFVDSFAETSKREAMAGDISLEYGPYAVDDGTSMPTVDELLKKVKILKKEDSPASSLREWISVLYRDLNEAKQVLQRIQQVSPEFSQKLNLVNAIMDNKTPVADWLSLLSLGKGEKGE